MRDETKPGPCPFCGARSRLQAYRRSYPGNWARVMCTADECKARGPTVRAKYWAKEKPDMAELKARAVELWNRRG